MATSSPKTTKGDLVGRLNMSCQKALIAAGETAKTRGNAYIELSHFLLAIIADQRSDIVRMLSGTGDEVGRVITDLTAALDKLPRGATATPVISEHIFRAIHESWTLASITFKSDSIRSGHLLIGILGNDALAALAGSASAHFNGLDNADLAERFDSLTQGSIEAPGPYEVQRTQEAPAEEGDLLANLKRYGTDLTAEAEAGHLSPVIGRDPEIRQIIDILLRRRQNNPILTGEAGVGKTAVVEGLAHRLAAGEVPPQLRNVSLYLLDIGLMLAGASMKGEFEKRLKSVIEDVATAPNPVILFIDEAHTLMGAGGASGTGDAANLLKPALARGELRTIAATTWSEYKEHIEKDPALTRRFQVVRIEEPDELAAIEMLRVLVPTLEAHHGIEILDEAISKAVALSRRYVPSRQLPDKAISLLDTACARVSVSQFGRPPTIEDLERRIASLESELNMLARMAQVGEGDDARQASVTEDREQVEAELSQARGLYDQEKALIDQILDLRRKLSDPEVADADRLRQDLRGLNEELAALQGETPQAHPSVTGVVVAEVVQDWTGIPVGRMLADETRRMLDLGAELSTRVFGQDHAMEMIAARMQTSAAGLDAEEKPVGVFLLCGTAGVGKTETALALADLVYGGEHNLITINMSEFQEAHTVSTLKGAPPGYVGYGKGGILTEAVRRKPYSVILLDEIEKAHPDVHEIFFQVFDKGMMDDSEGRRIDFSNALILITSNVGSDVISSMTDWGKERTVVDALVDALQDPLLEVFPAAFLSRVVTIPYYPLSPEMIEAIARHQFSKLRKRLSSGYGADLVLGNNVYETIAARVTDVHSGGRAIHRLLTNTLLPDLSRALLRRQLDGEPIARVIIDGDGNSFRYTFEGEAL
ncbi:MAG: type VI secretion system ATPase TssH [Paracoccaceae bacterium]|nr:type VI secretion system ATPase TssH [Paracoccaceae bacterium]